MIKAPHGVAATSAVLLACVLGCSAGYPPAVSDERREVDTVALGAARVERGREEIGGPASGPAKSLEADLFLSDAGKVVAKSIRAHGGWDAWTALSRVSYLRDRITVDERGQPVTGQHPQNTPFEVSIDAAGKLGAPSSPEQGEEQLLLTLPFPLATWGVARDYAGAEEDAKTGEVFERIRCARGGFGSDEWILLYFDYSSMVLKRCLERRDGKFTLILFSAWKDLNGVKLATKRSYYRLTSRFEHREAGRPDWIDVLSDIRSSAPATAEAPVAAAPR